MLTARIALIALIACCGLAACGVDGAPVSPAKAAQDHAKAG